MGRKCNCFFSNEEYEEAFYYEEPQTVFYNADGQEFTNDEKQFLAAHMNSNDDYLTYVKFKVISV